MVPFLLTFWTCYEEHNITAPNNCTDPKTSRGQLSRSFPIIPTSWDSYSYTAPGLVFVTNSIQHNWCYPLPRLYYKRLCLLCWALPMGSWMPCHKDTQAICGGVFYSEKLRYWANSEELKPEPANNHGEWVELRSDSPPPPPQTASPPHSILPNRSPTNHLVTWLQPPERPWARTIQLSCSWIHHPQKTVKNPI